MTNEVRPPRLVRSQSAESFHLDINYIDYHVNGLSAMHSTKFDFVDHPIAKKKKRKMKRKVTKHTGRFRELQKESHAFKELMECYQGNFPRGVKEVAVTKSKLNKIIQKQIKCVIILGSIRNGTYDRNNIPRAYVKGDQPLIDIVFRAVKDLVSSVVGEMVRAFNSCFHFQKFFPNSGYCYISVPADFLLINSFKIIFCSFFVKIHQNSDFHFNTPRYFFSIRVLVITLVWLV